MPVEQIYYAMQISSGAFNLFTAIFFFFWVILAVGDIIRERVRHKQYHDKIMSYAKTEHDYHMQTLKEERQRWEGREPWRG